MILNYIENIDGKWFNNKIYDYMVLIIQGVYEDK